MSSSAKAPTLNTEFHLIIHYQRKRERERKREMGGTQLIDFIRSCSQVEMLLCARL